MNDLRNATLAAKTRTGNANLGTRVEQGKFQIISVTYDAKGKSTIAELSAWVPGWQAIDQLNAMASA